MFRCPVALGVFFLAALAVAFLSSPAQAAVPLEANRTYRVLDVPAPSPSDRIQVILFYRYADPAMPLVMPAWEAWRRDHGPLVTLDGTPGVLEDSDGTAARVFFALNQSMRVEDLSARIVSAVSAGAIDPHDFSSWVRWLGEQGVDTAVLLKEVNSTTLREQTGNIPQVMEMYGVSSLPSVVIAGRYVVDAAQVPPADIIPTAKALVARLQAPR